MRGGGRVESKHGATDWQDRWAEVRVQRCVSGRPEVPRIVEEGDTVHPESVQPFTYGGAHEGRQLVPRANVSGNLHLRVLFRHRVWDCCAAIPLQERRGVRRQCHRLEHALRLPVGSNVVPRESHIFADACLLQSPSCLCHCGRCCRRRLPHSEEPWLQSRERPRRSSAGVSTTIAVGRHVKGQSRWE